MKEPKIRFKGFSGEWKSSNFEEVFSPLKNNSLSRADLSESGDIANIHYGDVLIKYGECVDTSVDDLTYIIDHDTAQRLLRNCALQKGDVIFTDAAEDNTVGKCSELICKDNERIVSGLHTIACRPKIKIADRYFGYYLNSPAFHNQLLPHIQGTKISSISRRAINTTSVLYPDDKGEQISLPSFFTSLDAQISASTSRLASLKQVKAASLQAMFPQEGETVPKVRFKGFEGEWKKVKFDKAFSFLKNNSLSRAELCNDGDIINIHYGDVLIKYGDILDIGNDEVIYVADSNVANKLYTDCPIVNGDIIIADAAEDFTVGKCVEVQNVTKQKIVSGLHTIPFRPLESTAPNFWGYYINSNSFHRQLLPMIQGSKISSISKTSLSATYVVFPVVEEQQSIASFFTSLDRQITLHAQRLEKLKQIKAACLDKMFV